MFKTLFKSILLTAVLAGLPINQTFAQNSMINNLASFNNGFISNQSPQNLELSGVDSVTTFQKGNTIVLQVTHNPKMAYQMLINKTLMTGARINGLNFQASFTLGVAKQYCDMNIFNYIAGLGYSDQIQIDYKNQTGGLVKRHNISQLLCRTFS